ncbi:MAG: FtsX-like permease family protein [Caldilineaceae bacterium]|nr:FtsX-like permease family protein [Caldilineaceae bacterium]
MSLRWRYAWRDLWHHKTRTLLVVISIAVGVFAFGSILGTMATLNRDLPVKYAEVAPASAILHTSPFDEAMADAIRRMPTVAQAEARFLLRARYLQDNGEWHDLELLLLEDYATNAISIVKPYVGSWPPPDRQLLIERNSLFLTERAIGETLSIETPTGVERTLPIAGLTHDMNQPPAQITGVPYAYVSCDTVEWLGYPCRYNELQLIVREGRMDQSHITQVAKQVTDKFEDAGYTVFWTEVPTPGHHFAQDFLPTIQLVLGVLGTLALVLSGFLVFNVITAILTQQTRQIGVMKAIGAQSGQVTTLYLRLVFAFGFCALLFAVPLGALGATVFSRFIAGQLNFDLDRVNLSPGVLALEFGIGLLVPVLAALVPILGVAGMTVRAAVQEQGAETPPAANNSATTALTHLQQRLRLPRPVTLSLRNTFRRRQRLIRTLIPLALGGAIFMAVLTLRASLFTTLEATLTSQGYDVQIQLDDSYTSSRVMQVIDGIPDVIAAEAWTAREAIPIRGDGSEADDARLFAIPPETQLYQPELTEGRWLAADETDGIVVAVGLLQAEPEFGLGSPLTLRINGEELTWTIIGVTETFQPPIAPAMLYVNQTALWRQLGHHNQTDTLRFLTVDHEPETHRTVAQALEERLTQAGIGIRSTRTSTEDRRIFGERFTIITSVLLIMSFLLATVGSLGLMGTMSINVLERKREVGVMRAIGATTASILQIFVIEGVIIGALSWIGGLIASFPIRYLMSIRIGMVFAKQPLTYIYDGRGPLFWLGIVMLVAAVASLVPARNAANLLVRETLAYE